MRLLGVNAGSSSLKLAALSGDGTLVVTAGEDLEMARQVRAISGPATDTAGEPAARRP